MDKKKGFTIIETSLVLAIAGLIFLMVFVALPALQRSARDTQRREDMIKLIDQIQKYQSNNRGALPTGTGTISYNANPTTPWGKFYKNYLGADFKDPVSDGNYKLVISDCGGKATGANCKTQYSGATFPNGYQIAVIKSAKCDGEIAKYSNNPRNVAVVYKLELGTYCGNTGKT